MKLSFKKLTTIFQHRQAKSGERDPNRDWFIVLNAFIIILIIIVGLNIFFFYGIQDGTLFHTTTKTNLLPPVLDQKLVTTVSTFYQDKQDTIDRLKTTPSDVVDPSL
jgi:hypothetical protein